jgi:hypothetical protein
MMIDALSAETGTDQHFRRIDDMFDELGIDDGNRDR